MDRKWVLVTGVTAIVAVAAAQEKLTPLDLQILQIETRTNLKEVTTAVLLYSGDYDNVTPNVHNLDSLKFVTYPYLKDKASWISKNPKPAEFRYNPAIAGVAIPSVPEPEKIVMFYESQTWPDKTRAVSFLDGSSQSLGAIDWGKRAGSLLKKFPKLAEPLPKSYGEQWRKQNPPPVVRG